MRNLTKLNVLNGVLKERSKCKKWIFIYLYGNYGMIKEF
jgi:hypothetical protein